MAYKDDIERLFRTCYQEMHNLASAILHDGEAASDIVNDLFTQLLQTSPRSADVKVVGKPYLLAAVRNRCLKRLRSMEVRERFRNLYLFEQDEADLSEEETPYTLSELEWAIRQLPDSCRCAFVMRIVEGRKMQEVAEALAVSERMAYRHLSHAVELLRQKLMEK